MLPKPYTVPTDGPVGRYLEAVGQHPWRPAHIHFKVTAPGHQPLVTQVFFPDDPYLENDTIGAVKPALVRPVEPEDDHLTCPFDIALPPAAEPFDNCSLGEVAALVARRPVRPLRRRSPSSGARHWSGVLADPPLSHERLPLADVTLRPVVPHPGEVRVRRAQLQSARRRRALRRAGLPGAVHEVRRDARRRREPVRAAAVEAVDYEAELAFVRRPTPCAARRAATRSRRSAATRWPTTSACATTSTRRTVAPGQELGGLDAARPVRWSRRTRSATRTALEIVARAQRRAHAVVEHAWSSSTSRRWWRRSPSSSRSRPATSCSTGRPAGSATARARRCCCATAIAGGRGAGWGDSRTPSLRCSTTRGAPSRGAKLASRSRDEPRALHERAQLRERERRAGGTSSRSRGRPAGARAGSRVSAASIRSATCSGVSAAASSARSSTPTITVLSGDAARARPASSRGCAASMARTSAAQSASSARNG